MTLDASQTTYAVNVIFPDNTSNWVPTNGVAWEELSGELATRITVTFPSAQLADGRWLSEVIVGGTPISVWASMGSDPLQECTRGFVEEVQPDDGTQGTFQVVAYDPLRALLANKVDAYYDTNKTPLEIFNDLLENAPQVAVQNNQSTPVAGNSTPWAVPLGNVDPALGSQTFDNTPQIFHAQSLADIVLSLLQQAYEMGTPRFIPRSSFGKLEIIQPGMTNNTVYWLVHGESVTRVVEKISTVDLVTRVVVLGQGAGNSASPILGVLESTAEWTPAIAGQSGKPSDFGTRQDVIQIDNKKTFGQIELAARKELTTYGRPKWDRQVESPDIPYVRKGDAIRITAGTMDARYSVESVTHDEPTGTMKLVLGNIALPDQGGTWSLTDTTAIPNAGGTGIGQTVDQATLCTLAHTAGFTGQDALTAVAIVLAGDPSLDVGMLTPVKD